jgi:hypothetical protein
MRRDIPLLIDELEVVSQLLPTSISLFERPFFPQLLIKELIDWRVTVYSCSRIAVPVPNPSAGRPLFVYLDAEA